PTPTAPSSSPATAAAGRCAPCSGGERGQDQAAAAGKWTPEEGDRVSGTMADLKRMLAAGPPAGLHLLLGDDELARDEACRVIETAVLEAEGGGDRMVVYGDEAEPDEIAVAAGTGSLFGFGRLVMVRRFDAMPAAAQERRLPMLTDLPAGVTVVPLAKPLAKRGSEERREGR